MIARWNNVLSAHPVDWSCGLNRGLMSWWLGLPQLAGGVTWRDIARHYHGTRVNSSAWVPNQYGTMGLDFTGGYVNVGDVLDFEHTDKFTLMAAFDLDATTGTLVSKEDGSNPYPGWNLDLSNGALRFTLIAAHPASSLLVTRAGFGAGTPYVVAAAYDGSTDAAGCSLVTNGIVQAWTTAFDTLSGSPANAIPLQLGVRDTTTALLNGRLHGVWIFDRELSITERVQWYDEIRTGFPRTLNRVRRVFPAAAAPAGLSIPIAMHHYKQMMGVN